MESLGGKRQTFEDGEEISSFGSDFRHLCLSSHFASEDEGVVREALIDLAAKILPVRVLGEDKEYFLTADGEDLPLKRYFIEKLYGHDLCGAISRHASKKGNETLLSDAIQHERIPLEIWYKILESAAIEDLETARALALTRKDIYSQLPRAIQQEMKRRGVEIYKILYEYLITLLYLINNFAKPGRIITITGKDDYVFEQTNEGWIFVPTKILAQDEVSLNKWKSRIEKATDTIVEMDPETKEIFFNEQMLLHFLTFMQGMNRNMNFTVGPIYLNMTDFEGEDTKQIWDMLYTLGLRTDDDDPTMYTLNQYVDSIPTSELMIASGLKSDIVSD